MTIDTTRISHLDNLLAAGLDQGLFLGAAYALVHGGERVATGVVGRQSEDPARPVTPDTIFDLASLTKPMVTATAILHLAEEGAFHLSEDAALFLPEGIGARLTGVSLRHLLTHTSGLPAWRNFHAHGWSREEIVARAAATEREHPIGARYIYSDLGYILLGAVVENLTGVGLAEFAETRILRPLGMTESGYCPVHQKRGRDDATTRRRGDRIAATRCPNRSVLFGVVHDENAAAMGGVAGHAGLFAPIGDVARYAAALLQTVVVASSRPRVPASFPLGPLAATRMARNALDPAIGGSSLGWFTPPNGMLPTGDFLPDDAFGHSGFTGTLLTLFPSLDLAVILLTNRVYQERDSAPFLRFRRRFHNAVASLMRR